MSMMVTERISMGGGGLEQLPRRPHDCRNIVSNPQHQLTRIKQPSWMPISQNSGTNSTSPPDGRCERAERPADYRCTAGSDRSWDAMRESIVSLRTLGPRWVPYACQTTISMDPVEHSHAFKYTRTVPSSHISVLCTANVFIQDPMRTLGLCARLACQPLP